MSKTADLRVSIWSDPWFVPVPADAKLLYLWSLSNEHANLSGLYVVARPIIEFETGLSGRRFPRALEALEGKLAYHESTGVVWAVGRVKHVRQHSIQIAKSITKAVKDCPHQPFKAAFIEKYGHLGWLSQGLAEARASLTENPDVEPISATVAGASHEAPSHGQRQGKSQVVDLDTRALEDTPPELREYVDPLLAVLRRVAEGKRGSKVPTVAAVAKCITDRPLKDFLIHAGNFEHYWLHGAGAERQVKDVVATFRNWLDREPDVAKKTTAGGSVTPIRGPVQNAGQAGGGECKRCHQHPAAPFSGGLCESCVAEVA